MYCTVPGGGGAFQILHGLLTCTVPAGGGGAFQILHGLLTCTIPVGVGAVYALGA